jgi:hypothetical protein
VQWLSILFHAVDVDVDVDIDVLGLEVEMDDAATYE